MHPNTTEKRTATDIVSQQHKASETGEANRVLINKNRCPQQDSSSTPTASPARRAPGPTPSPAAAQHGTYPVTPGLSGYARAIERYQRHQRYSAIFSDTSDTRATRLRQGYPILPVPAIPAIPAIPATGYPYRRPATRTGDTARVALMRGAALRACIIRGAARRSDPARAASDPASLRF